MDRSSLFYIIKIMFNPYCVQDWEPEGEDLSVQHQQDLSQDLPGEVTLQGNVPIPL